MVEQSNAINIDVLVRFSIDEYAMLSSKILDQPWGELLIRIVKRKFNCFKRVLESSREIWSYAVAQKELRLFKFLVNHISELVKLQRG